MDHARQDADKAILDGHGHFVMQPRCEFRECLFRSSPELLNLSISELVLLLQERQELPSMLFGRHLHWRRRGSRGRGRWRYGRLG